jgi:hypothetical protein
MSHFLLDKRLSTAQKNQGWPSITGWMTTQRALSFAQVAAPEPKHARASKRGTVGG